MINELISDSMTEKDAPTIADGIDKANEKLDLVLEQLPPSHVPTYSDGEQPTRKYITNIFKSSVSKHDIIRFLNADPESEEFFRASLMVESFLEEVKSKIVVALIDMQNNSAYMDAKRFSELIADYYVFITDRAIVSEDNKHFVLRHEKHETDSIRATIMAPPTGRDEVRGILPQKRSITDGKGILKVRQLDRLYARITGSHLLWGTKWGGWVDRDIADEEYDKLIDELANYSSEKETVSEQMIDVFRFAIDKCQIIRYIKCDPTHRLEFPILLIDFFKFRMLDLFDKYRHHQKDEVFVAIYRFCDILQSYNSYLSCKMWPLSDGQDDIYVPFSQQGYRMNWNDEQEFFDRVFEYRKEINELYGQVCMGETMFV